MFLFRDLWEGRGQNNTDQAPYSEGKERVLIENLWMC